MDTKRIDEFLKSHTHIKKDGKIVYCVLKKDIYENFDSPNKVIKYIESLGHEIVDTICASNYNHEDIMDEIEEKNPWIPDLRKIQIQGIIDELARDYKYDSGYEQDVVYIPHYKLLSRIIPYELEYAYEYIKDKGYFIRGNDLSMTNEGENFKRSAAKPKVSKRIKKYNHYKMSNKIRQLALIKKELKEMMAYQDETDDKEFHIKLKMLKNKYKELREEIILSSRGLVYKYIIDNQQYNSDFQDKIGYAMIGYIMGVDDYIDRYFDDENGLPASNYELSTFVYNKMKWFMSRFYVDEKHMIKKPDQSKKEYRSINYAKYKLLEEYGEYDYEELAILTGLTPQKIVYYDTIFDEVLSIDELYENAYAFDFYDEGSIYSYDQMETRDYFYFEDGVLKDDTDELESSFNFITPRNMRDSHAVVYSEEFGYYDIDDEIDRIFLKEDINKILSTLFEKERMVLAFRFGFNGEEVKTLEETAREFGITRERVRQIESKTIAKLRHPSKASIVKDYIIG